MDKIHGIQLKRLRHGECLQMLQDTLTLLLRFGVKQMPFSAEYHHLQTLTQRLAQTLNKPPQKNLRQQHRHTLAALDSLRLEAVQGLQAVVDGYRFHYEEEKRLHAHSLHKVFTGFATGIKRRHASEKTFRLRMLIQACTGEPRLVAALQVLQISDWFQKLQEANQQFAAGFMDAILEKTAAPTDTFSQIRPPAQEAWYEVCRQLNAYAKVYPETYGAMVEGFNGMLEGYRVIAAKRRTSPLPLPDLNACSGRG
jgi:hypothetical protein